MRKLRRLDAIAFSVCFMSVCSVGHARSLSTDAFAEKQYGVASFYSDKFHGRRTASGERYDKNDLTAQHSSLPFGTLVRVTNLQNDKTVEVRVNDRNGGHNSRILDLSKRAARQLGFLSAGLARVKLEVIQWGNS